MWYALAALVTSNNKDVKLRELLRLIGGGNTRMLFGTERREKNLWGAAASMEEGGILLSPTPVSLETPARPVTFATWSTKGPSESTQI